MVFSLVSILEPYRGPLRAPWRCDRAARYGNRERETQNQEARKSP